MDQQVVILAAGKSSRFFPFNQKHKSFHRIMDRPILSYTLESVKKAGFNTAIVVISDPNLKSEINLFAPQGLALKFAVQSQPLGQANAILSAKKLIRQPFFVLNCQHIFFDRQLKDFKLNQAPKGLLGASLRTQTDTPEKYGIFKIQNDRVSGLIEKPSPGNAPSSWRLVGTYYFKPEFLDLLSSLPTKEYQLEAAINQAAGLGHFFAFKTNTVSLSLKYPWDLHDLKNQLLDSTKPRISQTATVSATSVISGPVTIESGARIYDFSVITGPVYIGKNAIVGSHCQIRDHSILEPNSVVERYCDVKNSQIGARTKIHSAFIGDSLIGENSNLGAGTITANLRFDNQSVVVNVKNSKVSSHQRKLGLFLGDNSQLGIRVSTMPGTVIGHNSLLGPGISIKGTHPPNTQALTSNL